MVLKPMFGELSLVPWFICTYMHIYQVFHAFFPDFPRFLPNFLRFSPCSLDLFHGDPRVQRSPVSAPRRPAVPASGPRCARTRRRRRRGGRCYNPTPRGTDVNYCIITIIIIIIIIIGYYQIVIFFNN